MGEPRANSSAPGDATLGSACPSEDAILAFVRGDTSGPDAPAGRFEAVEDHIARCSACRQLVSALAPTSTPAGGRPSRGDTLVRVGEVVADKYEIERVLGQGGMGVVVQAMHLTLRKPVALKFLKGALADRPDVVARFFREARAAAAIDDEHVVRVLDAGRLPDTGEPYLALELLDGHDLATEIRARGRLPIDEAVGWVLEACKALSIAHARGIVHRDIKPANLFLAKRADGTRILKVLDFGIAKVAEALEENASGGRTSTGTILGSPSYMAPEQLEGQSVDHRVDVWALGVVLFELLTGELPFEGSSLPSICAAILTSPARSLRALRPEVPPELEASILLCWAKDREQRMPSVDALAAAISPFTVPGATGTTQWARPISTPPPSVPAPPSAPHVPPIVVSEPERRRSPRAWLVFAAAIGAVTAGAIGMTFALSGGEPADVRPIVANDGALAAPSPSAAVSETPPATASPEPGAIETAPEPAPLNEPSARRVSPSPPKPAAPASTPRASAEPTAPPAKAAATAAPGAKDPVHREGLLDRK